MSQSDPSNQPIFKFMATLTSSSSRVLNSSLASRIMSAEEAAALIQFDTRIGMSGFTGAGYPKAVPLALARRISDANLRGQKSQVSIFTGASTGPELDGALAMAGGIHLRLPYQSDPETRKRINAGEMEYMDIHLGHVAQYVEYGFLGKMDWALVEVTAILEDGRLIPSSSLGNNRTWIDQAEKVILEVNAWQPAELEGMHDIYYGMQPPPNRQPIPLVHPGQRIGTPYFTCGSRKSRRDRADRFSRPQQRVQSAGREFAPDCGTHSGIPRMGSKERTHSSVAAAACSRAWETSRTPCCSACWKGRSKT
jgi:succinyl-CoA:acetate CoA-transferase